MFNNKKKLHFNAKYIESLDNYPPYLLQIELINTLFLLLGNMFEFSILFFFFFCFFKIQTQFYKN